MLKISRVSSEGIGKKYGIKSGDKIMSFDNFAAENELDYMFYDAKEKFSIEILNTDGAEVRFHIKKKAEEGLGLFFAKENKNIKTCQNKCVFCFIDQLPKGMRESLYVKDDDAEMSFVMGNFVTLTNCSHADIERLARLKISPLYISVHSMNPKIRIKMLNNKKAGNIGEYLSILSKAGIKMHIQIVVVKGYNDKDLERTVRILHSYSGISDIAVVPCGVTCHRQKLTEIKNISCGFSASVIKRVNKLNKLFKKPFVYAADEFYIKAKKPVPTAEYYGEYTQIENGVGLLAKFADEVKQSGFTHNLQDKRTVLIVTGTSAFNYMKQLAKTAEERIKNLHITVAKCENGFFGKTVTCAGLLTYADILKTINDNKENIDCVLLPAVMLKRDEDVFLDGKTLSELRRETGMKIIVCKLDGEEFLKTLAGG